MVKSIPITLRLDTEIYTAIKRIATQEQIPASYVIRRLLRKGLDLKPGQTIAPVTEELKMPDGWE